MTRTILQQKTAPEPFVAASPRAGKTTPRLRENLLLLSGLGLLAVAATMVLSTIISG
ncbi:hypothetical protein [Roseibium litorale]|uniref:Uncharacterized protein n=1 Tax=Roseibium litorale TaxID=2803841 RepID=A0ABR9CTH1_9HYPH|nr:hypothetical protein [Roseibium litorale]MBD8893924.1 hypothetical protein [Roseibium litorale]